MLAASIQTKATLNFVAMSATMSATSTQWEKSVPCINPGHVIENKDLIKTGIFEPPAAWQCPTASSSDG